MFLNELLSIYGLEPNDIKLHMAMGEKVKIEPLLAFTNGDFKTWQEGQRNAYFGRKYILSLIYLRNNEWLFGGVYSVDGCNQVSDKNFKYDTTLQSYGSDLIGRVVLHYEKNFRNNYLIAENHISNMQLIEILRDKFVCDPFPGYTNAKISYEQLKQITVTEENSWKTALSIVNGIYVIADVSTGKLYIGKADGEEGIWQRWCYYAATGHGGNIDLIQLLKNKSEDYKLNFQYTILEVIPKSSNQEFINERETYWKEVFFTKQHGHNKN